METNLKRKLEYHYMKFDASQIFPDPLVFPRRFTLESDIEISAFVGLKQAHNEMMILINQ